ncbi:MAG: hypothetical protein SGCHY_000975 [Lobulomycetales sp.]
MSPGRALPQLLVLVLLNLLLATGVVHGSSVVLYKSFSPAVLVKDRECNVSITIFNTGDQVLRNIALSDNTADNSTAFSKSPNHRSGTNILILQPGASVTHSYPVTPRVVGRVADEFAFISYEQIGSTRHSARSASLGSRRVYSVRQYEKEFGLNRMHWAVLVLGGGALLVGFPWIMWQHSSAKKAASLSS